MSIKLFSTLTININIVHKLRVFLPIIITLSIVVLGYFADINSLQKKLHRLQKQILTSQAQISSQNSLNKQLADLKRQFNHLNSEYLTYLVKNSHNSEFAIFLKDLFNIANRNHIEITNITPVNNTKNDENDCKQIITIEFNGEYQQTTQFINSFAQLKLATYIQTLTIQKKPNDEIDNKLTTNLSLLIYDFHYKMHKQKTVINRDPFMQDNLANQQDLSKWHGSDLHLIGILVQDQQNIGVVKDPDGFVHYLTLNSAISQNHIKINKITANAIITADPSENIYREN